MPFRLVWITCLIVLGAAIALWFLSQRSTDYTETTVSYMPDTPSLSFNEIEMTINSSAGNPQYKLTSPKYWLYQEEQRSEFELPDITIYRNDGRQIFASALVGQTHENNSIITLAGDVRINQPSAAAGSHALQVMTDKLTVFPETKRATTTSPVTTKRGARLIKAAGMTLELDQQILYLHSNVQAHYVP